MTMLPPFLPQSIRYGNNAFPDVEPFSVRGAGSYEEIQYSMVTWIRDQLMPWILDNGAGSPAWASLVSEVNDALTTQANTFGTAYGELVAPEPSGDTSGATDQAALQAILDRGDNLYLRAGRYYVTGLVTPNTVNQPRIIGAGKKSTVLQGVGTAGSGSAVLRFGSSSGGICGGAFENFTVTGTNDVGIKLVGVCGLKWRQILFDAPFIDALQFFNDAGGFTEFNSGEAEFTTSCTGTAVHYAKSATGDKSFHNSGLTEGSIINQSYQAIAPAILIDANAHPYNAPLTVQVFTRNPDQPIIRNMDLFSVSGDLNNFRGQLTIEQFVDNCVIVDPNYNDVQFTGSLNVYGKTTITLGPLTFWDSLYTAGPYQDARGVRRKWSKQKPLKAGTFNLITLSQRSTYLVSVRVQEGAGYYYDQLLYVVLRADVGDGSGWVNVINTARAIDTLTHGAPVWGINNNLLTITNPNYSSATIATYSAVPMQPYMTMQ